MHLGYFHAWPKYLRLHYRLILYCTLLGMWPITCEVALLYIFFWNMDQSDNTSLCIVPKIVGSIYPIHFFCTKSCYFLLLFAEHHSLEISTVWHRFFFYHAHSASTHNSPLDWIYISRRLSMSFSDHIFFMQLKTGNNVTRWTNHITLHAAESRYHITVWWRRIPNHRFLRAPRFGFLDRCWSRKQPSHLVKHGELSGKWPRVSKKMQVLKWP